MLNGCKLELAPPTDVAVTLRSMTGAVILPGPMAGGYDVPVETTTLQKASLPAYETTPEVDVTGTTLMPPPPSLTQMVCV
jgi:hypothetical protein